MLNNPWLFPTHNFGRNFLPNDRVIKKNQNALLTCSGAASTAKGSQWCFCSFSPLFDPVVKLNDSLFLVGCLDGTGSQLPDLVNGVHPGDLPGLHEVRRQHGPGAAIPQHTMHRYRLQEEKAAEGCDE